jgi:Fe-Mn family superoxide dismutase
MTTAMTRRDAVKAIGLGALAASFGCATTRTAHAAGPAMAMPKVTANGAYKLPPLPYAEDSLEPALSAQIVNIHYSRHSQGYFNGLNATLGKLAEARKAGDMARIQALSRDLAFHGSGAVLHTLYWYNLTPDGGMKPEGKLADAIARDFGSVDDFQAQFLAATKKVEASGWGILAYEPMGGQLVVLQAENYQNLMIWGVQPLLVIDVWEHAYYLQYANRRGEYVDAIYGMIDWAAVAARYEAATA